MKREFAGKDTGSRRKSGAGYVLVSVLAGLALFLLVIAAKTVILAVGLGSAPRENREKLPYMVKIDNEECVVIAWEGRQYVPYCVVSKRDCGKQVGIVYGDQEDKVYEYPGCAPEEWIVNFRRRDEGAMLYREINVTEIPEGLESEYEWNN